MNNKTTTHPFLASGTTSTGCTANTYSDGIWATPLNGGSGTTIYTDNTILSTGVTLSTAITNSNNMNKQVKVAVFTVERNEDNKVISSKFVNEIWVEVKNGASLELSVAKQLDKDFDPSTVVIKEITSFTF
jgi:hypothetical protein